MTHGHHVPVQRKGDRAEKRREGGSKGEKGGRKKKEVLPRVKQAKIATSKDNRDKVQIKIKVRRAP